jgi:protein-S-isoprenylcysteine O-methyltransferase Ste14
VSVTADSRSHRLETRIPPPVVALLTGALMWWLAGFGPHLHLARIARLNLSVVLALLGISFAVAAVLAFRRHNTTVRPERPEKASALVTSGPYQLSRNPMYLGLLFMLFGWSFYLASPVSLLGLVAFMVYISRFQIIPEERALTARFGDDYVRYCVSVRRWV